jgi:hypothetical protein
VVGRELTPQDNDPHQFLRSSPEQNMKERRLPRYDAG